jgi:hypothetical protein
MKNSISEAKQSRAFVQGFQSGLWTWIEHRLELKLLDHYPDDPYSLEEIHEAMKFVLTGSSILHPTPHEHSTATSSQAVPLTLDTHTHIKSEDLTMISNNSLLLSPWHLQLQNKQDSHETTPPLDKK